MLKDENVHPYYWLFSKSGFAEELDHVAAERANVQLLLGTVGVLT